MPAGRYLSAPWRGVCESLTFTALLAGLWRFLSQAEALPWGGRDYAVFLQAVYRLQQGQIPHVDYYSPLGLINFALPALLTKAGFSSYAALLMGIGLLAWSLAGCAWFLFRSQDLRFALALAVAVFAYAFACVRMGQEAFTLAYPFNVHLFYNRLGFSILLLNACLFYRAFLQQRALSVAEQWVLAWCGFLAIYIKVSYFFALALLFGLWLALTRGSRLLASLPWLLLSSAVLHGLVLLRFGPGCLVHYYWDLSAAGQASAAARLASFLNDTPVRLQNPEWLTRSASRAYFCSAIVVLSGLSLQRPWRIPAYVWHWLFVSLLAMLSIVYFTLTNSGPIEVPALLLPILLAWLYCLVRINEAPRLLKPLLGAIVAVAVLMRSFAVAGTLSAIRQPVQPLYDPGAGLGVVAGAPAHFQRYLDSGKHWLRDVDARSGTTVLVFDLANILAPALHLAMPKHVPLFFHFPVDWSSACLPSFPGLMTDVDIVMVPKQALLPEETGKLLEYYGAELQTKFDRKGEDDDWVRYDRKPAWPRPSPSPSQIALPPSYCQR